MYIVSTKDNNYRGQWFEIPSSGEQMAQYSTFKAM